MSNKTNTGSMKQQSEIALGNVRELESAAFAFWVYAREHEVEAEELLRLMGVIVNLISPVSASIEMWVEAEEGLSNA